MYFPTLLVAARELRKHVKAGIPNSLMFSQPSIILYGDIVQRFADAVDAIGERDEESDKETNA